jgi:hypothetical protein
VFQLRCTAKLRDPVLKAVRAGATGHGPTTTLLGDWFANRFNFGAQRYIICTSELALLTVLIPARDLRAVKERLITAIDQVLVDLEVPAVRREREFRQMEEFGVAKTNSRSILGSMNDMAYLAEAELSATGRLFDLRAVNVRLAAVPCGPLNYQYPGDRAVELLEAWQE